MDLESETPASVVSRSGGAKNVPVVEPPLVEPVPVELPVVVPELEFPEPPEDEDAVVVPSVDGTPAVPLDETLPVLEAPPLVVDTSGALCGLAHAASSTKKTLAVGAVPTAVQSILDGLGRVDAVKDRYLHRQPRHRKVTRCRAPVYRLARLASRETESD